MTDDTNDQTWLSPMDVSKRHGIPFGDVLNYIANGELVTERDSNHIGITLAQYERFAAKHPNHNAPVAAPVVTTRPAQSKPPAPLGAEQLAAQSRHIQQMLFKGGVTVHASEGVRLAKIRAGELRPDDQMTIVTLSRLHRLEMAEAGIEVDMPDAIAHVSNQFAKGITVPAVSPDLIAPPAPAPTTHAKSKPTHGASPHAPGKRGEITRPQTPFMRWRNERWPNRQ